MSKTRIYQAVEVDDQEALDQYPAVPGTYDWFTVIDGATEMVYWQGEAIDYVDACVEADKHNNRYHETAHTLTKIVALYLVYRMPAEVFYDAGDVPKWVRRAIARETKRLSTFAGTVLVLNRASMGEDQ